MAADGINAAGGITGVGGSYGHQIFGQNSGDDFTNSIFMKKDKNANSSDSNGGRNPLVSAIMRFSDKVVDFAQNFPQRKAENPSEDPDIITKLEGTVANNDTQSNSSLT